MHRIRWSCEGLTSVHNEYTGYLLKHLLLRHMYNLPLLVLMCYAQALRSETSYCYYYYCVCARVSWVGVCCRTVLCGALYTACVDASRTVFWDRSVIIICGYSSIFIPRFWTFKWRKSRLIKLTRTLPNETFHVCSGNIIAFLTVGTDTKTHSPLWTNWWTLGSTYWESPVAPSGRNSSR